MESSGQAGYFFQSETDAISSKKREKADHMTVSSPRYRQAAFTLVEILVTAAIVSVLCTLLIGAFHRSVLASQQAACASNLRQIHAAMMGYPAENNGLLPAYLETATGKPHYYWTAKLRPYLNQPSNNNYWDNEPAPAKLFRCPADTRAHIDFQSGYTTADPAKYGACGLSGLNGLWFGVYAFENKTKRNALRAYPLASVVKPAQTAMIFDHALVFASGSQQLKENAAYAFRHSGRINVVYFDGHIGSLSQSELPPDSDPFWTGE